MIHRLLNFAATASLVLGALVLAVWAVSHRRHVAVQWTWGDARVALEADRGHWVWFTNDGPTRRPLPRFSTWHDLGRMPEWKNEVYGRTEQARSGVVFGASWSKGRWGQGASRGQSYSWWFVPIWPTFVGLSFVAAGTGAGAARGALAARVARRRARRGLCAGCGYDVRASPARCPECGAAGRALPLGC